MRKIGKILFAAFALSMSLSLPAFADEAPRIIIDPSVSGAAGSTGGSSAQGFIDEAGLQLINDAQERQRALDSFDALMKMGMNMNVTGAAETGESYSIPLNMDLDMDMKAKNIYDPANMEFLMDMDFSMPGVLDDSMKMTIFYDDGMMYMDMLGQKMMQPVDMSAPYAGGSADVQNSIQDLLNSSTYDTSYFKTLTVTLHEEDNEARNTVLAYTMDGNDIMNYVNQLYSAMGLSLSDLGLNMSLSDISGEITVNSAGYITRDTLNMTMKMSDISGGTGDVDMTVTADIVYNNAGMPANFTLPSKDGYQLVEQAVPEAA